MSKLAQAGDSSTASPGCASAAARRTASLHVRRFRSDAGAGRWPFRSAGPSRPISTSGAGVRATAASRSGEKSCPLPSPPRITRSEQVRHHLPSRGRDATGGQLAADPIQGGNRGADIGALGVVVPGDAVDLGNLFDAVRQAAETAQGRQQAPRRGRGWHRASAAIALAALCRPASGSSESGSRKFVRPAPARARRDSGAGRNPRRQPARRGRKLMTRGDPPAPWRHTRAILAVEHLDARRSRRSGRCAPWPPA
jgi:hypothetical protein